VCGVVGLLTIVEPTGHRMAPVGPVLESAPRDFFPFAFAVHTFDTPVLYLTSSLKPQHL
jgi:hypothetical protein